MFLFYDLPFVHVMYVSWKTTYYFPL